MIIRSLLIVGILAMSYSACGQSLVWSTEHQDPGTADIGGGTSSRPTVAAVATLGKIYIAYTNTSDSGNGFVVEVKESTGQAADGSFTFGNGRGLYVGNVGNVLSFVNPAMATQNGVTYLAFTTPGGVNWITYSTDMTNWAPAIQLPIGPTSQSMAITFNPSNSHVWISYMFSNQNPMLCDLTPTVPFSVISCNQVTTSGTQTLYNPGLIFSASNVGSPYMFVTWHGSSHCLSSWYTSSAGAWTYWNSNNLCGSQQTSSAPDPVFYNGYLYVAFRSNDASAAFDLIGGTISSTPTYNWQRLPTGGQHMDGSPDLLPVKSTQVSLLYPSELVNFYARGGHLYSVYGR